MKPGPRSSSSTTTRRAPGYILKRKDLAETYKAFAAKGSDALYKGEVGDKIVAFLKKEGGLITKDDLTEISGQVEPADPDDLSRLHRLRRAAQLVRRSPGCRSSTSSKATT